MAVLTSGWPPVLRAWRKASGAPREFRTFLRRILPVLAYVARFSDGRFYGAAFSPPLTCVAVECDIRPVGVGHSKTVQHRLFLANSDPKLYESAAGRRRGADPCLFGNILAASVAASTRQAEPHDRNGSNSTGRACAEPRDEGRHHAVHDRREGRTRSPLPRIPARLTATALHFGIQSTGQKAPPVIDISLDGRH